VDDWLAADVNKGDDAESGDNADGGAPGNAAGELVSAGTGKSPGVPKDGAANILVGFKHGIKL
jgi:hypothetical protein